MLFAWIVNIIALGFGVALGARALIDPRWASRLVRLTPDDQGGGFAEFRATYGGVFLGLHGVALLLALRYLLSGGALVGVTAAGAAAALCAGWAGAAFGRFVAILRDGADTRFNRISVGVELAMALALGAPWFVWVLFP
ncbi:MAG: hypothetical protein H7124_15410 [Phycisphaerales bacterium]|nr:hypothetical protein [Hyphomonadaceae bacterium]